MMVQLPLPSGAKVIRFQRSGRVAVGLPSMVWLLTVATVTGFADASIFFTMYWFGVATAEISVYSS